MADSQALMGGSVNGQIRIADEVIAIIAGTAAQEVSGVTAFTSNLSGDIAEMMKRKNLSKGVKVNVSGDRVDVVLNIAVNYGYKITDVSLEVQKKVKTALETMTGLFVSSVDVHVAGVQVDKN